MLSVVGTARGAEGGVTRRELMRVGSLSLFGSMTSARLARAGGTGNGGARQGRARSVILFNLLGGPSHQDMFDMKPMAPAEVRGEFQPVATSVPGLSICEHLPRTARLMHKACLIRSVTHSYNAHNPLPIMTGYLKGEFGQLRPEPSDPPDIGAVCQYLGMGPKDLPGAVCLPCYPGWGERSMYPGIRRPGPYGGYLGSQYDPLFAECEPTFDRQPSRPYYDPVWPMGAPTPPKQDAGPAIVIDRLDRRRSLLEQLDVAFRQAHATGSVERMDRAQRSAYMLMTSATVRDAFDLSKEREALRDRYGRNLFGSSLMIARRLVEAGVPFISVHAENFIPHGFTYDMHENNFGMLRSYNLPVLDLGFPALVEDLEARGLLETTLIVVMGEMGRTPRVNAQAGRDHWPQCGFCLLAGGGTRPGMVFGSSDKNAAYPASDPVSPADIVATIYHLLGIDPDMTVKDRLARPIPIAHGGSVIREVLL